MTQSAVHRAIAVAGSQEKLAELCGVTQQAVSKWARRGTVTAEYALAVERATGGQVTCSELRPDLYPPDRFQEAG